MPILCACCDSPLTLPHAAPGAAICPACASPNEVRIFPALFAAARPANPESALEGEAVCFDHPSKRAVAACHQCGRFVCLLCSVDFMGQVWCPTCVAAGRKADNPVHLDPSRVLYDSITLTIPFAALLIWPLTIVAGPGTLVLSAMTWKRPLGLVRHGAGVSCWESWPAWRRRQHGSC